MRPFVTLVEKEWRDVRTLTWVSMGLVVVHAALVRWYVTDSFSRDFFSPDALRYLTVFVPCVIALYGALIASDRVGGEVSSKRMDGLALLPVGPSRLWLAKTVLVLTATALFATWVVTVQAAVLAIGDGPERAVPFLDDAQGNLWVIAPVAGSVLCVLFASSLGLSGIAALLVGGMLAGVLVGAATFVPTFLYGGSDAPRDLRAWIDPGGTGSVPWFALIAPSALASWAIFVAGRVHLARWLRTGAIGAAVFLGMLAVPATVVAHEVTTLVPGEGTARVLVANASPDGRYVAMTVLNRADCGVVVLDLATGALQEHRRAVTYFPGGWNESGWQTDGTFRFESNLEVQSEVLRVDPASGRVVERRARSPGDMGRETRERVAQWKSRRWVIRSQTVVGAPTAKRYRAALGLGDAAATVTIESETWVGVSDDGLSAVFSPARGEVAVRTLPDGPDRTVFRRTGADVATARAFHGGRTVYVRSGASAWIVDAASGTEQAISPLDGDAWAVPTSLGRRRLVAIPTPQQGDAFACVLHDVDTGATSAPMRHADFGVVASELPDGRLLLHRSETSVVILDRDLRVERVLVGEE